jgi:organic radical activating enzyme
VPAVVYEHNNKILMKKQCPEHGDIDSVVEIDTNFYYNLHTADSSSSLVNNSAVLFEITDKCQLSCPHCYHLPDNKNVDRPIEQIVQQLKELPQDCFPYFAGAEPTLRKDFINLIEQVSSLNFKYFATLTNGIKFADRNFAQQCFDAGLRNVLIGLNHHSYQGKKIHNKQLRGIKNILDIGYNIEYVGYTIESLDDLPDILMEIYKIHHPNIQQYRIRCGSFIGRSSDRERSYLSNLVAKVQQILKNKACVSATADNNPYHVNLTWKDIKLRLIQWPDVSNIDLEELATGPWCQFYDGPITNFVHQVITRDAYINNRIDKLDLPPTKYQYKQNHNYWKHNWTGPVPFDTFKFEWCSDQPQLAKSYFRIHSQ